MKLLRLTLRNFKGIKEFTLEPNGADVSVFGDNAVGKTTLFDAFNWLLFGKDSNNRADFDIKTLDENNNPIHRLEHEVEAVILPDRAGRPVALRKVYSEKYTRRRGSATEEFTGHTTDHYIDGVPIQKREYNEFIEGLSSESVFRLLSDPLYFNEQMHWEERRKLLLEVVGDVTDDDVIASDKKLADFPGILGTRTQEEHRKVVLARRAEINKELQRIPVRIDEVDRGQPELPEADKATLKAQLADLRDQRSAKDAEKTRIESGGEVAEQRKRLAEIETAMTQRKAAIQAESLEALNAKRQERSGIQSDITDVEAQIRSLVSERDDIVRGIENAESEMKTLRKQWATIDARRFEGTVSDVADACPTCEQSLPAEQVEAAREKALETHAAQLAEFNQSKANELTKITDRGKKLKKAVEVATKKRDELDDKATKLTAKVAELKAYLKEIDATISAMENNVPDPTEDAEYAKLLEDKAAVESTIAKMQTDTADALAAVDAKIQALNAKISETESSIQLYDQHARGVKRIEELTAEEGKLAAEFERLEHELYLSDEFTKAKVGLLDERINSKFKTARFQMFRVQVNGGLEATCQTLLGGVPWNNINGAGKIQVGLDIINTLAEHYDFAPPIFIDDAVTITDIPATKGQQIRLIVSEQDKTLRIETSESTIREAV